MNKLIELAVKAGYMTRSGKVIKEEVLFDAVFITAVVALVGLVLWSL